MPGALGRKEPKTWEHVEKYPLSVEKQGLTAAKVPFSIGINWYSDFDNPVQYDFPTATGTIKRWVVAKNGIKGSIRGGHCVCIKPNNKSDSLNWYTFYDQGSEGACVGFGTSRMMSLLNRTKYNAWWLWDMAKLIDEWPETKPGDDDGTSVNAGLQVLADKGHVQWADSMKNLTWQQRDDLNSNSQAGIDAYRWTTSVDDIRAVLAADLNEKMQAVPFLNSWGTYYPHITWMPYGVLQRLLDENGEAAVVTDR